MPVFRYNGPWDTREVWGVVFRKGETVDVSDDPLIKKLKALEGFELVDSDALQAVPKADDYPAVSDGEGLRVPMVGAGTIPEDWKTLHWKTRVKLAKDLSGMDDISTPEAADATIEALLEAK